MGLEIGDITATSGMTKAIFDEIDPQLSDGLSETDLETLRPSWKKLAYAIAKGVIEHIKSNMEIKGIETTGSVNASVEGDTGEANGHMHPVSLAGEQSDVDFTQSNDGVGHVE